MLRRASRIQPAPLDGPLQRSEVQATPVSLPVCEHRGGPAPPPNGQPTAKAWFTCEHPDQPLGPQVCSCHGCGLRCPGYRAESTADLEPVTPWPRLQGQSQRGQTIGLYVVTNQGREAILAPTLQAIADTDWPVRPQVVCGAPPRPVPDWNRSSRDYRGVLLQAIRDSVEYALVLEDDVRPVDRFHWAVASWYPLQTGQLDYGSLYTPGTVEQPFLWRDAPSATAVVRPELARGPNRDWQRYRIYGSQAYLLSRRFLVEALNRWPTLKGGQDARVVGVATAMGWPLWHHSPDLVEHAQTVSAFATPPHRARAFSSNWQPSLEPGVYRHPESVPGWLTFEEGRLLAMVARNREVLELGRHHGRSTAALAQSARRVVSVDRESATIARAWLRRLRLPDGVEWVESAFTDAPPGPFDLVFVDGDHDRMSVERDLRLAIDRLRRPGLLALHDYGDPSHPGVQQAADFRLEGIARRVMQAGYLAVWEVPAWT